MKKWGLKSLIGLFFVGGLILPSQVFASIAYPSVSVAGYAGSGSSRTWSHTNDVSVVKLVVCAHTTTNTITGVTYNGDSLTQITNGGTLGNYGCYYKDSPATGANNVVVSYSGDAGDNDAVAVGVSGVNVGIDGSSVVGCSQDGSQITNSLTTSYTGTDIQQTYWSNNGGTTVNLGPIQPGFVNVWQYSNIVAYDYKANTTGGSNSVSVDPDGAPNFCAMAFGLSKSASAPAGTTTWATSTPASLTDVVFGIGIIIAILGIMLMGFMYNNMFKKKKY